MIALRAAVPQDAEAVAALFRRSREALGFIPVLHTADEDLWFVREVLIGQQRVTLAEEQGALLGFIAEHEGWVSQLYLDPEARGQGIGALLLDAAKGRNARLQLWCFAANGAARRFYAQQGFAEVEFTDGADNEAHLPDVRLEWAATQISGR